MNEVYHSWKTFRTSEFTWRDITLQTQHVLEETSHSWGDITHLGRHHTLRKTSHTWRDITHLWRRHPPRETLS